LSAVAAAASQQLPAFLRVVLAEIRAEAVQDDLGQT
jgi:hypothetical protein